MTDEEASQDVIKAISDKLAELEDLQLVNKLDIINVKNELDKASLSGGPSTEEMDKISELRQLVEKSDRLKKAERFSSEIDEIKAQFEKMKKGDTASLRRDFDAMEKEFEDLKGKLASGGKKGVTVKLSPMPKSDLEELRGRIGKLESAHPSDIDLELPEELREEIAKISGKISALEKAGSAGKMASVDELSAKISSLLRNMDEQKERIDGLESSLSAPQDVPAPAGKKGKKGKAGKIAAAPAGVTAVVVGRLDRLEKKISELYSKSTGQKEAPADGRVDELSGDLREMKAKVEGLEKKASLKVSPAGGVPESVSTELAAVREKVEEMEKNAAKIDPAAIEKLMKSRVSSSSGPTAAELSELRERMGRIEKGLEKASKIAMGLRPIELPDAKGPEKGSKEFELRVKDLEKTVGAGVGEERFRNVEKKMEEMREWLPEYIDNKVDKKLTDLNQKVGGKVKEMESLKKELIDSTIEQMLAQPATVGKMLGEKLRKQVDEMQERLKKSDGAVKPSDAKMAAIIGDISDLQKEMAAMRTGMKGGGSGGVSRKELEELEIDFRTLATRLDSVHTTVKGAETAGVPDVMRDLEILKTKSEWLESTVSKLDLGRIYERMEELESMVRTAAQSGGSGPIILE